MTKPIKAQNPCGSTHTHTHTQVVYKLRKNNKIDKDNIIMLCGYIDTG